MYTKDKNHRITLRLNDAQFQHVQENADILGVSPSDFLRMVINASIATSSKLAERMRSMTGEGGMRRENEQTDQHDFV